MRDGRSARRVFPSNRADRKSVAALLGRANLQSHTVMGALFVFIPVFIGIVFVLVIGTILFSATKGVTEWSSNNARPRETVQVRVATKRQHVSGGGGDYSARTEYFATFESLSNGVSGRNSR
jgi:hypothetical protein